MRVKRRNGNCWIEYLWPFPNVISNFDWIGNREERIHPSLHIFQYKLLHFLHLNNLCFIINSSTFLPYRRMLQWNSWIWDQNRDFLLQNTLSHLQLLYLLIPSISTSTTLQCLGSEFFARKPHGSWVPRVKTTLVPSKGYLCVSFEWEFSLQNNLFLRNIHSLHPHFSLSDQHRFRRVQCTYQYQNWKISTSCWYFFHYDYLDDSVCPNTFDPILVVWMYPNSRHVWYTHRRLSTVNKKQSLNNEF